MCSFGVIFFYTTVFIIIHPLLTNEIDYISNYERDAAAEKTIILKRYFDRSENDLFTSMLITDLNSNYMFSNKFDGSCAKKKKKILLEFESF